MPSSIPSSQLRLHVTFLLKGFAAFTGGIFALPRLRLLESNLCRNYYQTFNQSAIDVLTDSVPEELFFIIGILYSIISDHVSRETLLLVNVMSNTVARGYFYAICYFYATFDIRLIWVTSLFDLIGGGRVVFNTLTLAMIAESVKASSLTNAFFYLTAALTTLRMLGVCGGSYLSSNSLWLPIIIGYSGWALTIPLCVLLESSRHQNDTTTDESGVHLMDYSTSEDPPTPFSPSKVTNSDCEGTGGATHHDANNWRHLIRALWDEAVMHRLVLFIFVTHELAMGIRDIAEQWMSKRYHWPLQMIGYILAGQTLLSATILAGLPRITSFFLARKWTLTVETKDLLMMRCTLIAAAAGTAVIAFAWDRAFLLVGLAIFAFGVGFHDVLKAFVTVRLQDRAQVTRIFLWISTLEVLANMVNGLFWAMMYDLSLRIDGSGLGLPFLFSSGLFFGTILLIRRLR